MNKLDNNQLHGVVERRLYDGAKYKQAMIAFENGQRELGHELLELAAKPMFRNNKLWKLLFNLFNRDFKIPFITGYWTKAAIAENLVVTVGKQIAAKQLGGTTTTPVTAIALGTGTTAAAAGDTALQTEITTNGGSRGAATVTNITTTTTGDTEQWQKTFTFTGSLAITEEGLLDNNSSGGNLLAHQVFSAVNVVNTDTLQVTHKVQFS